MGHFIYGDFGLPFTQGLVLTINCTLSLLISVTQVILVVKWMLIFHGEWIDEVEDLTILWASRTFVLLYSVARFLIDVYPGPRPLPLIEMLSGSVQKRYKSDGSNDIILKSYMFSVLLVLAKVW